VGIIHGNQQDRNSGGEIWSRGDFRDGNFVMSGWVLFEFIGNIIMTIDAGNRLSN